MRRRSSIIARALTGALHSTQFADSVPQCGF